MKKKSKANSQQRSLPKAPTGIQGLDEITSGGLPKGRSTLIAGSTGCGKTMLAMEFLVHGAEEFGEPGIFMSFEETVEDLMQNFPSPGFDLEGLIKRNLLALDHVHLEPTQIEETGEYDLEGLFVRLGLAIDLVGAKRVALDTIAVLFAKLADERILRSELSRLFRWLKDKGVTAVITAESGEGEITRYGLEEYVSDCVILLEQRLSEDVTTRRLRIVKYRGSAHGMNAYPFLIGEQGVSVLPITSLGLDHPAMSERVSTGIDRLDAMFGGKGYYRGSSVLVSGTAGTGKSSVAASFVNAACARGESCLYFPFEESEQQIIRNMRSINVNLEQWVKRGLLRFHPARPMNRGLETHLALMHKQIEEFAPQVVVVDPITNMTSIGNSSEIKSMLTRLVDYLKTRQITALFTSLVEATDDPEQSEVGVSSLMDTWILLKSIEGNGERNRVLYVLKSRGMAHSNQVREFRLSDDGIQLVDVYTGAEGVLTGSARATQQAQEQVLALTRRQEVERRRRELDRKQKLIEAQIIALRAEFEAAEEDLQQVVTQASERETQALDARAQMSLLRGGDQQAITTHGYEGDGHATRNQKETSTNNRPRKRSKAGKEK
jgi:circadian clock protein KaiC